MLPMDCQIQAEGKILNTQIAQTSDYLPDNPLILQIPIQALFQRSNARSFNPQAALESYLRTYIPKRVRRSLPLH